MTTITHSSEGQIVRTIYADLRNGTPGLRLRAAACGFNFSYDGVYHRRTGQLRPGQFLAFVNNKRTQVVLLDHAGRMYRNVDLGRQITLADMESFLSSIGYRLSASTLRSRKVVKASSVVHAIANTSVVQPAVAVSSAVASPRVKGSRTTLRAEPIKLVNADTAHSTQAAVAEA